MRARIEWEDLDCRLDTAWLAQVSEPAPDGLVATQVPKQSRGSTSVSTGFLTPADRPMSARIEGEDSDCRLDATWLAQVSEAAPDGLVAKQVPKRGRGDTSVSTGSLTPADRRRLIAVWHAQVSRRGRGTTSVSTGSLTPADRPMSARIEGEDLDCRLDAAWLPQLPQAAPDATQVPKQGRGSTSLSTGSLTPADRLPLTAAWIAQVSEAAPGELVAKQVPKQGRGSTSVPTGSPTPADRPVAQEVSHLPRRRPGLVGLIFAVALVAGMAIPHLSHFQSLRPPIGAPTLELNSSEPLTSTTAEVRNQLGRPKLIVEPLVGAAGEPAPIGLGLAGQTDDAVIIIRGLLPGMELSKGDPVGPDTWQLTAADLRYAWIAPPRDFVGSADLVAELRLPNAQIAERQTVRVKWMARGAGDEPEQGQLIRQQDVEASRPVAPTTAQHPNDRDVITAASPVSADSSQNQLARQEGKSTRARGKNSLRRSLEHGSRRAPFETPRIGESTQTVKGFWEWSR